MALPQLNDSPKYELVIPSTKQKVRFRPFLVKEEKVMMMAMESENQTDILNTIVDTIKACVVDPIDTRKLTTFDVEYSFLQIRSKSVGESVTLNLSCTECEHENEIKINLDDIKVDVPELNNIIEITDQISVELNWPTFNGVIDGGAIDANSNVNQMFAVIRESITAIITEEERFAANDHTKEELDNFVESMNPDQFAKVKEYIEAMPQLKHDVKFKCSACDHDNNRLVEGMQSFF